MVNLLIIENDQRTSSRVSSFLQKQGYSVLCATDAAQAIGLFESNRIDVVLCAMLIPDLDGALVTERIREANQEIPIIIITEKGDLRSKQRAFSAGCDDYMVKPVDLNELVLRIEAMLRRAHIAAQKRITIGNAVLDSSFLSVTEGDNTTVLPPKEFMILFKLCFSPGRIFTRREIMNDVWGAQSESNERTVDVHIKRLRKKFENSSSFKIETVRGVGYKANPLL